MKIVTQTKDELIVTHREPPARIVAVSLCFGFILLVPVLLPRLWTGMIKTSVGVEVLLIGLFLVTLVFAVIMFNCREIYRFSTLRQNYLIRRVGPFGSKSRAGKLAEIREVYQESYDDNDALKEFVILAFDDGAELRLPRRSLSFTEIERSEFGAALAHFLGVPVRLDNY